MKGSEFVKTLPEGKTASQMVEREMMLFDAVRRHEIPPILWAPVVVSCKGHTATFLVSADTLRIGDALDSIRIVATHPLAQRIADELGVVLPTPKLSDEIWAQASVRIPPRPHLDWTHEGDGSMALTRRMIDQSNLVDMMIAKEMAKTGESGLIADVGKDWVTTKKLWLPYTPPPHCEKGMPRAANYGWHVRGAPSQAATPRGGNVWQSIGLCHRTGHVDYSQPVRLVRRDVEGCSINGNVCWTKDIAEIARDPELSCLLSHEGSLPDMRHPGLVPSCDPAIMCPSAGQGFRAAQMLSPAICSTECVELPPPSPPPQLPDKPTSPPSPSKPAVMALSQYAAGAAGLAAGYLLMHWWFTAS